MKIVKLSDNNSIETMKSHVAHAIDNPEIRVFQILGFFGIGKRTAIRGLFDDRKIVPVEHNYTIIETAKPIVEKITKYPDAIHLWDDVFSSNIMHPEVLSAFQRIQNGGIDFNGTFLLVANDQEFTEDDFPPFPGVHINFDDITVLLSHLERQMRREGEPDSTIRYHLRNVYEWRKEGQNH